VDIFTKCGCTIIFGLAECGAICSKLCSLNLIIFLFPSQCSVFIYKKTVPLDSHLAWPFWLYTYCVFGGHFKSSPNVILLSLHVSTAPFAFLQADIADDNPTIPLFARILMASFHDRSIKLSCTEGGGQTKCDKLAPKISKFKI
jgi:hypothetical protein